MKIQHCEQLCCMLLILQNRPFFRLLRRARDLPPSCASRAPHLLRGRLRTRKKYRRFYRQGAA